MRGRGDSPCKTSQSDMALYAREAAEREIETLPIEQAVKLAGRDDTVLVDIRDIRELQRDGRVPGAFHCPRGLLEFWIDPQSPYHKPVFAQDKKFVFFCAGGLRSALAPQTAQRMGLKPLAHIHGGFVPWQKAVGPFKAPDARPDLAKKAEDHCCETNYRLKIIRHVGASVDRHDGDIETVISLDAQTQTCRWPVSGTCPFNRRDIPGIVGNS